MGGEGNGGRAPDGPVPRREYEGHPEEQRHLVAGGASGASEGRFRALLASVSDMVTVTDRDGKITYASPATERMSGFTPEEFMARDPFDIMQPEDRPRYREALEKLSDSPGMSLDLEHRVSH